MLGRPIPFSSSSLTRVASVNRGGGWVNFCSGINFLTASTSPSRMVGNNPLPSGDSFSKEDLDLLNKFEDNYDNLTKYIDKQDLNSYMNFIVENLFAANKYFNDEAPWNKKSETKRLNTIIYVSLEIIRKISIMLYPIIPSSSLKVLKIFNIEEKDISFDSIKYHNKLIPNNKIDKIDILFKKIDSKND